MKKGSVIIIVLALTVFSLLLSSAGEARGYYGWRGGWGWYGPGAFAGGVAVGAIIARPWYYGPPPVYVYPPPAYVYPRPVYVYPSPPPAVVYSAPNPVYFPNQAYAYPDPALTSRQGPSGTAGTGGTTPSGQWVEVPGQNVAGTWVPPHRAWVPANP
jgi:hypothetical protein